MSCNTAFQKSLLVLRRPVGILSENATRLTRIAITAIAAILFVELLDCIQIEMNLLIATIVGVLPLVVRPVVREVYRSHVLLEGILLCVESLLLVGIFVKI